MARGTSQKNTIEEGWALFERWARNFRKSCLQREITPALTWLDEIRNCVAEYDDDLHSIDAVPQNDKDQRIRDQVGFFRGYLVDISFDQGPFAEWVKKLFFNHNNRDWKKGYSFFLNTNNLESAPPRGSYHFNGFNANLFCNHIADIDFASAMDVLPFDRLAIRNKQGRDWSAAETQKAIAEIEEDLEFDGLGAGLEEDWSSGGYLFLHASNPWWSRQRKTVTKKKAK